MTRKRQDGPAKVAFNAAAGGRVRNGEREEPPTEVTLSCGVVLKFKPVPSLAIREAAMRIQVPEVPKVLMEDKGREEENPNDPDYLLAVAEHKAAVALVANNVILILGTEIGHVPDGMARPEEDGWLDEMQVLGIEFDTESRSARKLAWLKFYAIRTDEDTVKALMGPMRSAGVSEVDVASAIDSFRSDEARPASDGSDGPQDGGDGADVREPDTGASS